MSPATPCMPPPALVPPRDGYDEYYAEKLWSWLPEIHRMMDGEAPANGALRALVEIAAAEAAILRRDIDRLWDDQAIELCDDWAVAYLGALVGARPLSRTNPRGRRLSAARAIAWQRRKGTVTVLRMAIRDIAGIDGAVDEAFRRLVRFPHRLDISDIATGPVTGSPGGGFAKMTSPRIHGLTDSAFDEMAHFSDPRRLRGPLGRYGLRKVNLHLFTLLSQQIELPTPLQIAPGRFTLDPSGRDVTLFQRGQMQAAAGDVTGTAPGAGVRDSDFPIPITCRRFNATRHDISTEALAAIDDPGLDAALAPLVGLSLDGPAFRRNLLSRLTPAQRASFTAALLDATLAPDAPKALLWGDSLALTHAAEHDAAILPPSAVVAADLSDWQAGLTLEPHVALAIDPATGRLIPGPALTALPVFVNRLHLGWFDPVGAIGRRHDPTPLPPPDSLIPAGPTGAGGGFTDPGPVAVALPQPMAGTHRFTTSRSHEPTLPPGRDFTGITQARLDAADGARPYLRFRPDAGNLDITFTAAPPAADSAPRSLVIDGLWLGIAAALPVPEILSDPATPVLARLILDGDFDQVTLRHVTLDPGGEQARNAPSEAQAIPMVRLEIKGQIDRLLIERSITGPIWETNNDPALCNAGRIEISDSIVQSIDPAIAAIRTRLARLHLTRCTVLGAVEVAQLHATDSIIRGRTRVTDNQNGCFRYSATGRQGAILPPQFEAFLPESGIAPHWLQSLRFGDPAYAMLSPDAPRALAAGAENGAEMGVFNDRAFGVAMADLAEQIRELLPVGQTPQFIPDPAGLVRETRP